MRAIFLLSEIAVLLLCVGCLHGPVTSNNEMSVDGGALNVEIWASTNCANKGDVIHLRGRVTNASSSTQVIEMSNKPVFDIGINIGNSSANWSDNKATTPDLTRLELKPGESKTIEMDWVPPAAGSGSAGAALTYADKPGRVVHAIVEVNVVPYCPGFGP